MSKNSGSKGSSGKVTVPQKVRDQNSQQRNANKGTDGTNIHYDKVHGNRGKQIAENQKSAEKK